MKHLTGKEILKKLVEYWKKNHKKYITGKPEAIGQPEVGQWILQSYINYEEKEGWKTDINMCHEFDEIFKFIIGGNDKIRVSFDADSSDDYYKVVHSYLYHENCADDCLAFQEYGGCTMEEHEEVDFIVKTVMMYYYTLELNNKYNEYFKR
jgi:hypothetical protein